MKTNPETKNQSARVKQPELQMKRAPQVQHAPAQAGAPARARASGALQRSAGNARLGRALGAPVQAKLTVGAPGDAYEQEANQVADQVLRKVAAGPSAGQCPSCGASLRRQPEEEGAAACPSCAARLQRRAAPPAISRVAGAGDVPEVTPETEGYLGSSRGGGAALPDGVRAQMEPAFGQDFGGVRVHTDSRAQAAAGALQAQAFTSGRDIYFGAGRFQPGTREGDRLLAHELTHVVQQGAQVGRKLVQRDPDPDQPFTIRFTFNFRKLGIPKDSSNRTFQVEALKYFQRVYHGRQISDQEANAIWDELEQRDPARYKWNITQESRDKGSFDVQAEVDAQTFIESRLEDNSGEARLPSGFREGYEARKENFDDLPAGVKQQINDEANRRYWEATGLTGEKIKKGEQGKAKVWLDIRDKVIAEHEFLTYLPSRVKRFMSFQSGTDRLKPEDYEQLMVIANLVMDLTEEEVNEYLSRNPTPIRDLAKVEKSIRDFMQGQPGGGGTDDDKKGDDKKGDDKKGDDKKGGGKKGGNKPGTGDDEDEDKKPDKKSGSKYGRLGLINLPQPIIDVLEKAAEILGDPEEMTDLVDLIDELTSLNDISSDIFNIFRDEENILLLALGLIDNPAIEALDSWVYREDKKPKQAPLKGATGIKGVLLKVRKLLPAIKKALRPLFAARRVAMGVQFNAALLLDTLPAGALDKLLELAKGGKKQKRTFTKELEAFAKTVTAHLIAELNAIPELLKALEKPEDIELIDKEDLGKLVAKAVIKLAGGIYGKIASKLGADDLIADIAKHGTKYTIPDALVDGINGNLNAIFKQFVPLIQQASAEIGEVLDGLDAAISEALIPGLEAMVSPKARTAAGARLEASGAGFLATLGQSRGQRLPEEVAAAMGAYLGHDLHGVTIHTDAFADEASAQINAVAFTIGDHIYFQDRAYDLESESGVALLAHELTHVVQHSRDRAPDVIRRRVTKPSLRKRLAEKLVGRVLRGTGKTKRSIQGPSFIDYGYIDGEGRPRGIIARLDASLLDTGSKARPSIRPPGFKGGAAGHARCHLLGNQLGGSGSDKRNLVTCFQSFNNTDIKTIENTVYKAVSGGETILYKVIPLYRQNGVVPYAIRFTAKGDGSPGTNIDETLTNRR